MTPFQLSQRKKSWKKLFRKMKELFPVKKTELDYGTPWELLVAVILSAQCTDAQVNKVTQKLFKKYKRLEDYVKAKPSEFEKDIYSTGFYRNKTKSVLGAAKKLSKEFNGVLPKTMAEMITIPGVGRKTANVVLQNLYDLDTGIAVDTHVLRFAIRYGLTDFKDPVRIERDLMEVLPKKDWREAAYYIKQYGRSYGPARNWKREEDPVWSMRIKNENEELELE